MAPRAVSIYVHEHVPEAPVVDEYFPMGASSSSQDVPEPMSPIPSSLSSQPAFVIPGSSGEILSTVNVGSQPSDLPFRGPQLSPQWLDKSQEDGVVNGDAGFLKSGPQGQLSAQSVASQRGRGGDKRFNEFVGKRDASLDGGYPLNEENSGDGSNNREDVYGEGTPQKFLQMSYIQKNAFANGGGHHNHELKSGDQSQKLADQIYQFLKEKGTTKRQYEFVGKRNYEFVGKKRYDFLGKRPNEDIEAQSHSVSTNPKPYDSVDNKRYDFLGKRNYDFLGKRNYNLHSKRSPYEFVGKRGPYEFVGKRGPYEFVGKRGPYEFVGKRGPYEFVGKRGPYEFVGKRGPYEFVGKRGPYEFVGKRGPYEFVGKRSPYEFVGKRYEFVGKRSPYEFVGKRYEFVGKRSPYEFVGKRSPYQFLGKRDLATKMPAYAKGAATPASFPSRRPLPGSSDQAADFAHQTTGSRHHASRRFSEWVGKRTGEQNMATLRGEARLAALLRNNRLRKRLSRMLLSGELTAQYPEFIG